MRQIFILERDEMMALRQGQPLVILLGKESITLQADVKKRAYTNGPKRNGSVTEQVLEFLKQYGHTSAIEITKQLGVKRASVTSALQRMLNDQVKRRGKGRRATWTAI